MTVEDALGALEKYSFVDIDEAKVDIGRKARQGESEVIFGEGKTSDQIRSIVESLQEAGQRDILITRLDEGKAAELKGIPGFNYIQIGRIAIVGHAHAASGNGYILICTGGTSDIPVAEEAAITAEFLGNAVERAYDVGVAGIHRLLQASDLIEKASCIIAVAGMEGALASVVGGIARCPVIAVPTSVGYGSSFGGIAALLAMLNTCASGVTVVNIDNGFGAGVAASRVNHPQSFDAAPGGSAEAPRPSSPASSKSGTAS